jgi:hypothetical protein
MIPQVFRKNRIIFNVAMVAVFSFLFALSGCDCGSGSDDEEGESLIIDNKLVNAASQAWVDDYAPGWRDGFILSADGKIVHISDSLSGGASWAELGKGAWGVKEDTLSATTDNAGYYIGSAAYTQSANLDTLYFGGEVLVRASVSVGAAPTGVAKARVGIKPIKKFRAILH